MSEQYFGQNPFNNSPNSDQNGGSTNSNNVQSDLISFDDSMDTTNSFLPMNHVPSFNQFAHPEPQRNLLPTVNRSPRKSIIQNVDPNDDYIDTDDDNDYSSGRNQMLPNPNRPNLYNSSVPQIQHNLPWTAAAPDIFDSDAALALKLQQEEYSRNTMLNDKPRSVIQRSSPVHGATAMHTTEVPTGATAMHTTEVPTGATAMSDAEYAAMLQAEEDKKAREAQNSPLMFGWPFAPYRVPSHSTDSDSNGTPNGLQRPSRHPVLPYGLEIDPEDDAGGYSQARSFFEAISQREGQRSRMNPPIFRIIGGPSRRRRGHMLASDEDFGPEDYERLLELDNSIKKKNLTESQINRIPIEKFRKSADQSNESATCPICLESYNDGDALRRLICQHSFHQPCLDRWLKENNICPVCREIPIQTSSGSQSRHRPGNHQNDRSNRNNEQRNNRHAPNFHSRGRPPGSRNRRPSP